MTIALQIENQEAEEKTKTVFIEFLREDGTVHATQSLAGGQKTVIHIHHFSRVRLSERFRDTMADPEKR